MIYFRNFSIGRHMFNRHIYLLLLDFICNFFQFLIYFSWSERTSFKIFCVSVNFIIISVCFWKICNEMILQYKYEARIFFRLLRSVRLLLEVRVLKDCFLWPFSFSCCLNNFSVWCEPPQWMHLDWEKFALLLFLTELSKIK